MHNLRDNQLLVTISDGKTAIRVGSYPEVVYSSCPDKPYENIQNSINAYMETYDIPSNLVPWAPKGCSYKGTGNCNDCN